MSVNTQNVIQALIRANKPAHSPEEAAPRRPVITISRDLGSGGDQIARALAERLGLDLYDMQILDAIAASNKVNAALLQTLHERVSSASDAWLYSTMFGKNVSRDDYLSVLVTTVRGIYRKGGIIIGRGGHIILAGRDVLRIRITGSVEACARRLAQAEGIALVDARKRVRERQQERGRFIWRMFRARVNDPTSFDLVINTDHFGDFAHVLDVILLAVHAMGLDTPPVLPRRPANPD